MPVSFSAGGRLPNPPARACALCRYAPAPAVWSLMLPAQRLREAIDKPLRFGYVDGQGI
jgi:hypothetical protein